MDSGLAWTIVGSVAGAGAVVMGILQLRQGRKNAGAAADGDPARIGEQAHELVRDDQAALPSAGGEQFGQFIQAYIKDLQVPSPPVTGSLVVETVFGLPGSGRFWSVSPRTRNGG